jgi:NADH-quinone oxidoreductase subunit H
VHALALLAAGSGLLLLGAQEGFLRETSGWVATNDWFVTILKVITIGFVVPGCVAMLVWTERRGAAFIQDRLGPNRVGPFGLFQSFADLGKLLLKEDVLPGHVNKPLYMLAPGFALLPVFLALSFIPFTEDLVVSDVDAGILAVFAFSSLGVYALALGGWSSNSKYPLIGGVRASAQMISYEITLGLAALSVFVVAGTLRLKGVVYGQADGLMIRGEELTGFWLIFDWNIWKQPVGGLIFLVAAFAETNRHPFDMPEAESELAAGYHTEYSSMKFAFFFLAEYAAMIAISGLFVTLYLGGWTLFGLEGVLDGWVAEYGKANAGYINWPAVWRVLLQVAIFGGKTFCMLFLFIWVRWTVPRFRYDQLMRLGWKTLLPTTLVWLVLTTIGVTFAERLYVPAILKGMALTMKHLVGAGGTKKTTMQYPEEKWDMPAGYRGVPALVKDPDGREKCVSCSLCEYVCPPRAISIIPQEIETNVEKGPHVFDIDMLRCIFCGYCEEVCPEEAIFMSKEYEICGASREEMVYGKDKLYEIGETIGVDGGVQDAVKKWENAAREAAEQEKQSH